jgi:poly(R)-hydroxyalkanoic acid synthase, class III, PhaC subunit
MGENVMETMIKETAKVQQKLLKGFENLINIKDVETGVTPKELVYQEDKVQLFHYVPVSKGVCPVPLIVVYALVNRQYMMDIQDDLSLFRKLLDLGLDLYVIDWGYPTKIDKYLTMEDYILGYLDNAVDFVREKTGSDKINVLGICQGGTLSIIYAALFPEKVKNLVTMVAPVDFASGDALLNVWAPFMDVDLMVDVLGNIPGELLNLGFLWLKPFQLIIDKYVGLLDRIDDPIATQNFLRMEKWIFDSPDQAGETFRKWVKELFQENRLCKGEFELGGKRVDLKKITMPVLNMFGEQDHLVSPKCSRPLSELVGSKDVTTLPYPVGHIGMYVSSRAQKEMAPTVARWLIEKSGGTVKKSKQKKSVSRKSTQSKLKS